MTDHIKIKLDDGFELNINKAGKGPSLIIQHGWTGNTADWKPIIDQLSQHFTCYYWDVRTYYQENVTIDRLATDVQNLIEQEKLTDITLVGHSMGALVSWEYINLFGCDNLRLLVIIDQTPKLITDNSWQLGLYRNYPHEDNVIFEQQLEDSFHHAVIDLILNGQEMSDEERELIRKSNFMQDRTERLKDFNPKAWIDTWKSLSRKDFRQVLGTINVPVYLAYGDKSNFYGIDIANYVKENTPNAMLHIYPGSGHHPHMDYKDDFVAKVVEYAELDN